MTEIEILRSEIGLAYKLLAEWVAAVDRDSSWDGWDYHYKRAKYGHGPHRTHIDAAMAALDKAALDKEKR